jgi:hypothetical protein
MRPKAALAVACLVLAACGYATAGTPGATTSGGTPDFATLAASVEASWQRSGALAAWTTGFVPLGSLTVEPEHGFVPNGNLKASYGNGWVRSAIDLPTVAGHGTVTYAAGGTTTVATTSAAKAFADISPARVGVCPPKEGHPGTCDWVTVTAATLGEATIATSRGAATVPVWEFTVDGLAEPLRRVAVAPEAVTAVPAPAEPDPARRVPGLVAVMNLVAVGGSTITASLGIGACDSAPTALVWESADMVVLGGTVTPPPPDTVCTANLVLAPVTVTTTAPVGTRVIVDAMTGQHLEVRPGY